ncbi:hypothetical protein [Streptomyces sp. NPDC127098]|uniref:hypothetical protein n=1 Tax=Streptomyces sp. NPDC127098 TaxID=3347137 RepID=UPI00365035AF
MRNTHISGGRGDDPRLLAAQARLAELSAALDAHAAEVTSIDGCRLAVSRIDEELRNPAPDGRRLTETLEMLNHVIGPVTAVTSLVEALKTTLDTLLG